MLSITKLKNQYKKSFYLNEISFLNKKEIAFSLNKGYEGGPKLFFFNNFGFYMKALSTNYKPVFIEF